MTPETLLKIMPYTASRAGTYAPLLTAAMVEFNIDTALRQAAFLAQVCHESGSLRYTLEVADGRAYEGKADLGNTQPGDGPRYRGRGLIQITGRANYGAAGLALGQDLLATPEMLEQPALAARSAGWFWKSRGLNAMADTDAFGSMTKKINGGYNGLDDRLVHWLRARKVLGL